MAHFCRTMEYDLGILRLCTVQTVVYSFHCDWLFRVVCSLWLGTIAAFLKVHARAAVHFPVLYGQAVPDVESIDGCRYRLIVIK